MDNPNELVPVADWYRTTILPTAETRKIREKDLVQCCAYPDVSIPLL
jgi:hypothetical protein